MLDKFFVSRYSNANSEVSEFQSDTDCRTKWGISWEQTKKVPEKGGEINSDGKWSF